MRLVLKLSFSILALLGSSLPAWAEVKIGIVDVQRALQATSAGKKAKTALDEEFGKRKKDLDKKEAELRKLGEDFEKKRAAMSESALQQRQSQLQGEFLKFRELVGRNEAEFQTRQREVTGPILDKLQKTIDRITREQGYQLVLEKSAGVVLYSPSLDITDLVVKEFEKTN